MRAARKGSVGIVAKLIQHGANVNLTNKVTPCTPCLVCVHCTGMQTITHGHVHTQQSHCMPDNGTQPESLGYIKGQAVPYPYF